MKPSSLGDIVHTLPAVALIRRANPKARITWLVNPEWAPLLRGNADIDHVHLFPRGEFRGLTGFVRLLPWLRRTRRLRPEAALDFQGLLRSALIARVSGARRVFGLSDAREGARWLYHKRAQVDRRSHAVERYLRLAETFGATIERPLQFRLPSGDPTPHGDDLPPFVLLHPFARGRKKSMGDNAIKALCRALAPTPIILVGQINRLFRTPENCINLLNQTTLLQLVWLIRRALFTVTVDSGPMHIAAALSSRLVSIHTWSDPRLVGPYNPDATVWKAGELLHVRDLPAAFKKKSSRPFASADVPPLAAFVQQELAHAVVD